MLVIYFRENMHNAIEFNCRGKKEVSIDLNKFTCVFKYFTSFNQAEEILEKL